MIPRASGIKSQAGSQLATAGLVGGALARVSGLTILELHCVNFQVLQVLVWHTAVVPVSAAAGALVGWAQRRRS
jgi:hypothetical protein